MNAADLQAEVNDYIREAIESRGDVPANWATKAIVMRHPLPEFAESEWYGVCAYEAIRAAVRLSLQRYKPKESGIDPEAQSEMFPEMQVGYLTERNGEFHVVKTDLMTRAELLSKADALHVMGVGCFSHERAIRRFVEIKWPEAV